MRRQHQTVSRSSSFGSLPSSRYSAAVSSSIRSARESTAVVCNSNLKQIDLA